MCPSCVHAETETQWVKCYFMTIPIELPYASHVAGRIIFVMQGSALTLRKHSARNV